MEPIFLIYAVLIVILLVLSFAFVRLEFDTGNYPLDASSLVLCVLACVGIMFGFSNVAQYGFDMMWVILPIVIGAIALVIFVKRQFGLESPLFDLRALKNKYFFAGTLFSSLLYFTMCGLNVIMPLFAQTIASHDATTSGLILLPAPFIMMVFNFIGPVMANKFGVRKVVILSCIFSAVGYLLMMTYTADTPLSI